MSRPIVARIDFAALRHNYGEARRRANGAFTWAVIKANAYGHGLERVYSALCDVADGFALIELDAAVRLRELGATQPLLLLEGFYAEDELDVFARLRINAVIHCREQVEMLLARPERVLPLHIKWNTGMNRLGFVESDRGWLSQKLERLRHDGLTMMTHFADADGANGIDWQLAAFERFTENWQGPVSLANSAALLRHPSAIHAGRPNSVRPGIMLYGGSPFADVSAEAICLRPVMSLDSAIIAVQDLRAGNAVGYGCTFRAERPMRVGVVAGGYADGYPRHATTGTPILVDGKRTRTLGRVSMDKLAVDLAGLPAAGVGSPVRLWGPGLPADEVAAAAGTISYQLFCALAPRVPVSVA